MKSCLILLAWGLVAASQAGARAGSIDDFIAREMPISGAPGLAYAIVEDGNVRSDARGVVLTGGDQKITPNTPFLLGSLSKSFTAMGVMQLVEAGKVDLDAKISQYLDAFSGGPGQSITIRQLLSHTSGFSTLQGNGAHSDKTDSQDELSRQVDKISRWVPAYEPGTRWEYSNTNYQVLGALIEAVTRQDFPTYIETRVLQPIGMDHSFVADGQPHEGMARGHRPWFGTKRPVKINNTDRVTAPQGGVIASANDVARYLAVLMNGEDDVVTAKSKAAMLRPASEASPFYGFGWFIDTGNGTSNHSGSSPGIETLATLMPAKKKGVVVLVNAGSGIGFGETSGLRNGITARALGLEYVGEGNRWQQKAVFIGLVLLPLAFLFSTLWAWLHRDQIRAKSGAFGLFSLWFPVLMTFGLAASLVILFPRLFGVSISTLGLFQPDLGLCLVATAVSGVMWALFRLGVAYSGRIQSADGAHR